MTPPGRADTWDAGVVVTRDAPDCIHLTLTDVVDAADAHRRVLACAAAAAPAASFGLLCETENLKGITPQARKVFAQELGQLPVAAIAVLHASLSTRALANLVVVAMRILRPGKQLDLAFFDDEHAARAWLAARLDKTATREREPPRLTLPAGDTSPAEAEGPVSWTTQLEVPWSGVRAPHSARLTAQSAAWAGDHGVIQSPEQHRRYEGLDVGALAARIYPGAPLIAQQLIADLAGWLLYTDDVLREPTHPNATRQLTALVTSWIAVLDGLEVDERQTQGARALADLRARFLDIASDSWFCRFTQSLRRYWLGGVLAEARQRGAGQAPGVSRYLEVRMQSVGVYPLLDLAEAAYGFHLPAEVVSDPLIIEARRLTAFVVAIANDVFCADRPAHPAAPAGLGEDTQNIVHLLMLHEGRSRSDAFQAVIDAHNELARSFEEVSALILRQRAPLSPALRLCVEGHRRLMRGFVDWQSDKPRAVRLGGGGGQRRPLLSSEARSLGP